MEINLFESFIIPTFKMLWVFWPLWVLGIVMAIFGSLAPVVVENYLNRKRFGDSKNWKDDRDLLNHLRKMDDKEFEYYVAEMFKGLGYEVERTGKSGDHGLDVKLQKDGLVSYVQCKRFSKNNSVGEAMIREFLGSLEHEYVRAKSYFVTTSVFTEPAKKYASEEQLELIDGWTLVRYVRLAQERELVLERKIALESCPKCGSELIEKKGRFGKFLSCNAYPKCDFTKSLK